jgi:16S rRNA (uracil1498-N3)-methyltransferase
MAHIYRFFGQRVSPGVWCLDDDEAHHALKVLRLVQNDLIEVMDGQGQVAVGRLVPESKSKALIHDAVETKIDKDLFERRIILGALKPGDLDDLISPLVELGIDQIIIFHQSETAQFRISDSAVQRWKRLVRSAIKQSKRPWDVKLTCVSDLASALDLTSDVECRWMLTPDAQVDVLSELPALEPTCGGVVMLIGGERGLSETEESLAVGRGFRSVRLGPWILRARTAAQAGAVFLGMLPRPPGL